MISQLEKAIEIATKYHKWQLRKDWTLSINHPIAVMNFLKKYNFQEEALIAAVLHDVCEDTTLNNFNLSELFWERVWFIVNALSKNKKPDNQEKLKKEFKQKQKQKKVSNLEKYTNFDEYVDFRFHIYLNRFYTWIIAEPFIFFIKIADQIHNLSDMKPFSKEKKLRKIREIEKYFLPIYKKCSNIFNINLNSAKLYKTFIEELETTTQKAKNNL